jgi:hypothetical protein
MTTMRHLSVVRVLGPLVLGALGCGLISSDITKLSFDLPTKMYVFDSQTLKVPAGGFPAVPCGGAADIVQDCCNPPAPLPKPDCVATPLVCESSVCTLKYKISVAQTMDLKKEVPQLSSVNNQSLADISLAHMRYDVVSTLNIDLPPLELYLAAAGVMDATDPSATKFGTVPSIPAGMTASGEIIKEPDADQTFAVYGHAFGTPFNFIATTTVSLPSGSQTPTGRIDITINGQVSAKLSL